MTLVLATLALAARARRAVRLVDDHEIGRRAQERPAVPLCLDEVDARDQVRIVLVDREILPGQIPLEPGHGRRAHYCGLDREFLPEFPLPLLA